MNLVINFQNELVSIAFFFFFSIESVNKSFFDLSDKLGYLFSDC